jgi:DNA-binding GntR family transcriptional regulator
LKPLVLSARGRPNTLHAVKDVLAPRSDLTIADVLRESIRQRMLPPGMALIQQAVADAMGVSRIPVREALQRLASEGLVVFGDDGVRVAELAPEEIDELWSLRAVIESSMAEATAKNVTAREMAELRELVRQMDDATDTEQWSNLNFAFHDRLYEAARLPHYRTVALRVLTQIEPYSRVAAGLLEQRPLAQAEHHEMIEALAARDAAKLGALLAAASHRARRALVDYAATDDPTRLGDPATDAARQLADRLMPRER